MTNPAGTDGPITQVHEGMTVFDSAGEKVGKVKAVRMGDPQAATAKGQESAQAHGLLDHFAAAFDGIELLVSGPGPGINLVGSR